MYSLVTLNLFHIFYYCCYFWFSTGRFLSICLGIAKTFERHIKKTQPDSLKPHKHIIVVKRITTEILCLFDSTYLNNILTFQKNLMCSFEEKTMANFLIFLIKKVGVLGDSNRNRTHNHLVHKWTLNHLAKWLSFRLLTRWLWVRFLLQSLKFPMSLHKKWSFPSRISLINVTKSAVFCGFSHIYWRNP